MRPALLSVAATARCQLRTQLTLGGAGVAACEAGDAAVKTFFRMQRKMQRHLPLFTALAVASAYTEGELTSP